MTNPVFVRQLQRDDIEAYMKMFSPVVQAALFVSSLQQEREYVIVHLEQQLYGMTHFYGIFLLDGDQLIGAIEIRDANAYRGQLYCWINEQYWGTGYFLEAMRAAVSNYFSKTGALYFNALVSIANKRSYRALKKCGFADSGFIAGVDGDSYELALRCR